MSHETPLEVATAPLRRSPDGGARVLSVDVLRGLVITLMIFVNDVAGAPHAPGWLKHVSAEADAMTLPDVVFPAFLFIAGMSIPLSFQRARSRGVSNALLVRHVFGRALALLAMGVVMVNQEELIVTPDAAWWQRHWGVLAFVALCLALTVVPEGPDRRRRILRWGRWVGAGALVVLALVYRGPDGRALVLGPLLGVGEGAWLRHSWWGILGLIGWAYLIAALLYLWLGPRREWLLAAAFGLLLVYVAAAGGLSARLGAREWLGWIEPLIVAVANVLSWIDAHVSIGSTLGSLPAIMVAGTALGSILTDRSDVRTPRDRLRWTFGFAATLFVIGLLFEAPFGLNKIRATPAWCCYCAAITALGWAGLFWWVDLRSARLLARVVAPAGANPLLAYLLHPLVFLLAQSFGVSAIVFFYRSPRFPAVVAILGSLLMALFVVQATGWIARRGFRLKV